MLTGDNSVFQLIACILISVLGAYGGGRIHQWYKHSMDRDRSFREGYSHGYHTLFAVAARNTRLDAELHDMIGPDGSGE
ncbi:hypothetical protein ACIA5C_19995 [Actinoplanes sp. NPDC051343]|jgi:hypothetical protein|uniref:hypothetical protein n=1 Tax=Actinoplanes sp. NPDC051343 TaxID=3363906 RepID=UPI0037BB72E3